MPAVDNVYVAVCPGATLALELEPEATVKVKSGVAPLNATDCGLLTALSENESEALRAPVADGVNVTFTVQVEFGATVPPVQVSALVAKSPALAPPIVTVETVRFAFPSLVRTSVCAPLAVPTAELENARDGADRFAMGPVPEPVSATVCVLF
jgi:hypothetical protein